MVAFRIMTAANEHAIAPLPQHQLMPTFRTRNAQLFDNMAIVLMQRANVVTGRVLVATEEGTVFSMAQ